MSVNVDHIEDALRPLIAVLQDGQKGLFESGEQMEDPSIKTFFLEESRVRARFADELQDSIHGLGVADVKDRGTTAGALHRGWANFKVKLGGGDHALLVTAEHGEDEAKAAYENALKQAMPANLRDLLRRQLQHVVQAHNKVRFWRDTKENEK